MLQQQPRSLRKYANGEPESASQRDHLQLATTRFASHDAAPPGAGFHLAFGAPSREAIDAFHARGLAAGGLDNGRPGPRPAYGKHYYAAFVIDPDGHHLEAVSNDAA